MTNLMRAARIHKYGEQLQLEEIPVPKPTAGQLLIAITASGVCHTDVHACAGDMPGNPELPFIPGHEIVGRVASLGTGVSGFEVGEMVGLASLHWACGQCGFCQTGRETLCPDQLATGYSVDGGFAEYVLAPADFTVRLPENIDPFKMAPILCAGVTTYKGLKETQAKPGDWVIIMGVGGLGHIAIQYARELGFRVGAVDIDDKKLALAQSLGAELIVNCSDSAEAMALVRRELGGAQAVLVTAASAEAPRTALGMLRRGGRCVLNGLPPGDFSLPICDLVLAGQSVHGSIIGTRADMNEAVRLAVKAGIESTIEKQPLENINTVFDRLRSGDVIGRVVLDMSSRENR